MGIRALCSLSLLDPLFFELRVLVWGIHVVPERARSRQAFDAALEPCNGCCRTVGHVSQVVHFERTFAYHGVLVARVDLWDK